MMIIFWVVLLLLVILCHSQTHIQELSGAVESMRGNPLLEDHLITLQNVGSLRVMQL